MKNLFATLVLALTCICSAWAQEAKTYNVSTPQELIYALTDPSAVITLTGDIDFRGFDFVVIREKTPFRGSIDGNGHAIMNLQAKYMGSVSAGNSMSQGLINYAENASFKNLYIKDSYFVLPFAAGILVGSSKNSIYDDIHICNTKLRSTTNTAGGILGKSEHDQLSNCTVDNECQIELTASGSKNAGGLVGIANHTIFTSCKNAGTVGTDNDYVGGIVGYAVDCSFERCVNEGHIYQKSTIFISSNYLGGMAGYAEKSYFYLCTNYGTLDCDGEYGGGIVGYGKNTTVSNCHNATSNLKFDSTKDNGGIIGYAKESKVVNNFSVCDIRLIGDDSGTDETSGNNYRFERDRHTMSNWEMGVTTQQIESGLVAYWLNRWDANDVKPWRMGNGPTLNPEANEMSIKTLNPTVILTAQDLVAFAERVNGGSQYEVGVLGADINLQGIDFKPIGTNENRFRGIFDGRGHTISNLKVNVTSGQGAGLFGTIHAHADIRDVIIAKGSTITNTTDAGAAGIVGLIDIGWHWGQVNIERCGSYADVNVTKHGGGILGRIITNTGKDPNVKVFIDQCFNMGTITASQSYSALLVGYAKNHATISNSWAGGNLETQHIIDPYPYDESNGNRKIFAGFGNNISLQNCYQVKIDKKIQNNVDAITLSRMKSGQLTYQLNGGATSGSEVAWYQKIGKDEHPMLTSKGNDIVYATYEPGGPIDDYTSQIKYDEFFTNDASKNGYISYGSLRVGIDHKHAILDGNSKLKYKVTDYDAHADTLYYVRQFKKNVPATVVFPFQTDGRPLKQFKLFTFAEMQYNEETDSYQAIMAEWGNRLQIDYCMPFLLMPFEDTDTLAFYQPAILPMAKYTAETVKGDWTFVGNIKSQMRLTEKEEEEGAYYGFAGQEVEDFKLGEFARLGAGATIPSFRCYLKKNTPGKGPERIDVTTRAATRAAQRTTDGEDPELDDIFGDDDEEVTIPDLIEVLLKALNGETGIAKLDTKTGEFTFEGWYDLNGNRVDEDYQGIRVNGNKKVIVK